jgi:glycosyltransferase involved in cell wall biosynthesis
MTKPLISVIIPTRNRADYLSRAIEAMLAQTYENIEIIIIDDNSTDNTQDVAISYAAKYPNVRYELLPFDDPDRLAPNGVNINAGWMARNYGMTLAQGDLITFQDDDDGSCSNRLEFQYALMEKYQVLHVNVDWQQYRDKYNGRPLDYQITDKDIVHTERILALAKKTEPGLFKHPFTKNQNTNILAKILKKITHKFFVDWTPYPCAASMPLFNKKILSRCRFRQLYERTRPSDKGRGADRDFNFWVAETFKSSIAAKIPLVLWRVKSQNPDYLDEKYRPK